MPDAFSHIRKLTDAVHPLNEADWEAFRKIWTPFTAKRKEWLTCAGEKEKYLYFVVEGVQRVVYFDDQEREATLVVYVCTFIWGSIRCLDDATTIPLFL